ncbi:retrovirus-related Pol polyprotein from transposon 17.6 [Trichonephila clavipes]|nr:retrovirus-related Pol polyprotein from transposon 17.6 [Trichonephila clavipes]
MAEEGLEGHIIARLEPQLMEYVEIRNPTSRSKLLKMILKYEDRYLRRDTQGSSNNNRERRDWNARRRSLEDRRNRNWQDERAIERQNDRRDTYRSTYGNRPQRNQVNQGFENVLIEMIEDSKIMVVGISSEIRVRVGILTEGTEDVVDKPGLTHVLHHEIDTADKPPVVSRPYRYDRVKQDIIDYQVGNMLWEGIIIPIQSPYASPVVLCRKNNGLSPNNPEAYTFAVDYRKLEAITRYPSYCIKLAYPLTLIEDLITNIPHT